MVAPAYLTMEENWDDDTPSAPAAASSSRSPPKQIAPRRSLTNYEDDWDDPLKSKENGTKPYSQDRKDYDKGGNDRYNDSRRNDRYNESAQEINRGSYRNNDGQYTRNRPDEERKLYEPRESRGRGGFQGRGRDFGNQDRGESNYGNERNYERNNDGNKDYEYPKRRNDGDADIELIGAAANAERPPVYHPEMPSEDPNVIFQSHISEGIDFNKYNDIVVKVSGGNEDQEFINSFDECCFFDQINANIKRSNYRTPTPIQKFTIPIILKDEFDIMGCAQTGSGKTAAYLIPTFSNILKNDVLDINNRLAEPYILVISPTRELTNQIGSEMRKFSFGTKVKTAMVYGGVSSKFVSEILKNGCDSLSATPGRLLDLVNRGWISLERVKYLILDEADRMLDMGFIGDIRKIVFRCGMPGPDKRRCFMFSATFPQEVRQLAREILAPGYYFITVGVVGSAAGSISQEFYLLAPFEKRNKLMEILEKHKGSRILVFVDTKRSADFLTTFICQKGLKATSIHGDRYQEQREEALKMFRSGETTVLVATSVAARGLDIKDVQIVVNFDLPSDVVEYVHRIGRTGRLGNKGLSISFFTQDKDEKISSDLVQTLRDAGQKVPQFLENYDYNPVRVANRNERDDRKISSRTHHVNPSQGYGEEQKKQPAPYVEAVEEQWD